MTSALLIPFPDTGHTEPMAALGARLREDGHEVAVFAESSTTRWHIRQPLPHHMYATADAATLCRHLFLGDVADMARDIVDLAHASRADLIVTDVMMPGGGLAAELAGLPWVSLSCSPVPALDAYRTFIDEPMVTAFDPRSTREALGLPADDDRNLLGRTSDRLHLIPTTPTFAGIPTTPTFAGDSELPAAVALTGPFAPLPGRAPEPRPEPPVVVVAASTHSLSTLGGRAAVQDRYVAAAVEALAGLPLTGLVTRDDPPGRTPPTNVRFLGPVPHDELFDRASAVVTHAGWGTVSRALLRGLPLVLVPISGDQPYIAARCADLGLGLAMPAETVTAAELREAIRAVVEEPRYRKAADELAVELRAMAPLATASSLITSMPASEG
jgi:UDP:flavonoid glycosyltransferase YjiC (YdhE family)